jgi:hypothetical protein
MVLLAKLTILQKKQATKTELQKGKLFLEQKPRRVKMPTSINKGFLSKAGLFVKMFCIYGLLYLAARFVWQDIPHTSNADVEKYQWLSTTFLRDGKFSFFNYAVDIRGYLYPLLIFVSRNIIPFDLEGGAGLELWKYSLVTLLMLTAVTAILLPKLFDIDLSDKTCFYKSIGVAGLVFVFWRWVLSETLTDMWAFFFALSAVVALKSAGLNKDCNNRKRLPLIGLSGLLAYAAYNTRTIFLFFMIALCLLIIVKAFLNKRPRQLPLYLGAFLLGVAICGIPQALVNINNFDKLSIAVDTTGYANNTNQFINQIEWGIAIEKMESIEDGAVIIGLPFPYRPGEIMLGSHPRAGSFGGKYWLTLIISHPLDMTVLYFRHLLNTLTVYFPEAYVANYASAMKQVFICGSIGLWILGALSFLQKLGDKERISGETAAYVGVLLVPVMAIVPTWSDARFGISAFMLLYGYLCFCTDWKRLWAFVKGNKWAVTVGSLAVFLSWLTVAATTLSSAGYLLSAF